MKAVQVGNFSGVDASGEASDLVAWMRAQREGISRRQADVLGARPGERVLDIGCGPGADLAVLTERVGPTGVAIGLDLSVAMCETAVAHGPVVAADAGRLPVARDAFDACWARLVLLHVDEPAVVLADAFSALRPGGRIVVLEPDHGSHVAGPCDLDLFERIRTYRWTRFKNARVGRAVPSLLAAAGFTAVTSELIAICYTDLTTARAAGGPFDRAVQDAIADGAITEAEGNAYVASLEDADRRGAFFFAALAVLARATKPA